MKKKFILFIFIMAVRCLFSVEPIVSNITVFPEADYVLINYNLEAAGQCKIVVVASADSGETFNIYPTALTGDYGTNVMPGNGKEIIWNTSSDNVEDGSSYRIKIIARDNPNGDNALSFVEVESGYFYNGTADVALSSFYIDKYEVTQGEYEAVMGINPSSGYGNGNAYPVNDMTWFDAIRYCNLRSLQEGFTPCYNYNNEGTNPNDWTNGWNNGTSRTHFYFDFSANGYRLPTEMEWMYAAKGGNLTSATEYNQWPGTNSSTALIDYAWYWDDGSPIGVKEVGGKLPNELGLYDMAGNVKEKCWDIYAEEYNNYGQVNPTGPFNPIASEINMFRILRGGSSWGSTYSCKVTIRFHVTPIFDAPGEGFRLVRSIDEAEPQITQNPTILPEPGIYSDEISITLSGGLGRSRLYYTLDGSIPNETSLEYTEPFTIASNSTVTVKAYKSGCLPSEVISAEYLIIDLAEDFVIVEGGPVAWSDDEATVSSFLMSKFEVTQAKYEAVMGENPSNSIGANKPVEQVSWYDTVKFCNLLSMQDGLTPCYEVEGYGTDPDNWPDNWEDTSTVFIYNTSANGYRLPTQNERRYAAKGGNLTDAYISEEQWAGTNSLEELTNYAWYSENNVPDATKSIGRKLPNELGIYDMSGNVTEWIWDAYNTGVRKKNGGSYLGSAGSCRILNWTATSAWTPNPYTGFRICCNLQ